MSAVGVIVPVRSPARYLAQALDSALAQRPAPARVVVVDDASPEPVRLEDRHGSRCELIRRETRGGPARARADAAALLDTPLLALLDADDVWLEGKLAAQSALLEREPDAALCFARARVIAEDGRPTGETLPVPPEGPIEGAALAHLLFRGNPLPTSSVVARRAAIEEAGGFAGGLDADRCEDWDLWLRMARSGATFRGEAETRTLYRRHGSGLTDEVAEVAEQALVVQERHGDLVDEQTRHEGAADHLTLLARGRVRQRRYREAREALGAAAGHRPPPLRDRALAAALAVPGLRAGLGRRPTYR